MNRILESYEALKEAKGFKASLVRVGVAALVGIGVIALLFGFVGGLIWLMSFPETHPIARAISVVTPPLSVLTIIWAITFIAYILLFPERVARKDKER